MALNYSEAHPTDFETHKFSIVTVCKNADKSISRTIQSVLSQTYSNFELIIIDGASIDKTLVEINQFDDSRIRLVSEPDRGIFHAMNKGIKLATGNVLSILNSDDYYMPNSLEQVDKFFRTNLNVNTLCGDVLRFSKDDDAKLLVADILNLDIAMVPHPGVFVKSSTLNELYFDEQYSVAADYDFIVRRLISGGEIMRIPMPIANYTSGGFSDLPRNRILSIFETRHIQKRFFPSNWKSILRKYRYVLGTLIARDGKIVMLISLFSSIRKWGFL